LHDKDVPKVRKQTKIMKLLNLAISLKRVIKAKAKSVKEKDVVMQGLKRTLN